MEKINIGQNVPEQLQSDLNLELLAIPRLNKGITLCTESGDNGTRALLEDILTSEEEHIDWLESQLELINQVGTANYLAQQIHEE